MNIDIKHIAKSITRKQRGLADPQLIYPARDWALGIMGTLLLIFGATLFCFIQYRLYTDLSLDEEVVMTLVPYRTALVEQAIEKYQARAEAHLAIISAFAEGSPIPAVVEPIPLNDVSPAEVTTPDIPEPLPAVSGGDATADAVTGEEPAVIESPVETVVTPEEVPQAVVPTETPDELGAPELAL